MRCYVLFLAALASCSGLEESQKKQLKERNERKDLVHRLSTERLYLEPKLVLQPRGPYPWEANYLGGQSSITKELFRCRCASKHSLPMRGGQEFMYPILLEILSYLQAKTGKAVVITCGHRCPTYHAHADPSLYGSTSKHMIGAEVDFYVAGLESKPLDVVNHIIAYYKEKEAYRNSKEYQTFLRLEATKLDIKTPAWYNKEILIKLYQKEEGRDCDNNHTHPYLSIQVRFDREKNEKVTYSWEKAFQGYVK